MLQLQLTRKYLRSWHVSPPTMSGQSHLFGDLQVPPWAHGGLHIATRKVCELKTVLTQTNGQSKSKFENYNDFVIDINKNCFCLNCINGLYIFDTQTYMSLIKLR